MSKNIIGVCHLCGTNGPLSFEHVPPKRAFNNKRVIKAKFQEVIGLGPDAQIKGQFQQKGAGGYTLCPKCNNDTGSWYGSNFVDWCYQGLDILVRTGGNPSLIYINYLCPLRILKQIVTMFASTCSYDFGKYHPELVRFVLDPKRMYLSPKYRFFVYYNIEGIFRCTGISASLKIDSHKITALSEISFPPYGYVMTIDSDPPDVRLIEITHFSKYRYGDFVVAPLKLHVLPTHLYFPGDYRTKDEIYRDRKRGLV
jgi:hypothetical protein